MRIRLAIPDHLVTAPALEAALEATMLANEASIHAGEVPTLSAAIAGGVRWKPEPYTDGEHFDLAHQVAARGWGDCDDLAPWLAAELRASGDDPGARPRVVKTGRSRWHVVVETSDGKILDPSKWAGMKSRGASVSGVQPSITKPMALPQGGALCVVPHAGKWWARCDLPWADGSGHLASHGRARTPEQALDRAVAGALVCGDAIESPLVETARALASGLLADAENLAAGFEGLVSGPHKLPLIAEELSATLSYIDEALHKPLTAATLGKVLPTLDPRERDAWWKSIGSDARQRRRADWSWIHDRDPQAASAGNWNKAQAYWWGNLNKTQRENRRAFYIERHDFLSDVTSPFTSAIRTATAPIAHLGRALAKSGALGQVLETVIPGLALVTTAARAAAGDKLTPEEIMTALSSAGPLGAQAAEKLGDTLLPGSTAFMKKGTTLLSDLTQGKKFRVADVTRDAVMLAVDHFEPELKATVADAMSALNVPEGVKLAEKIVGRVPGALGVSKIPSAATLLHALTHGQGAEQVPGGVTKDGGLAVPLAVAHNDAADEPTQPMAAKPSSSGPILYYHPAGSLGPVVMRF